MLIVGLSGKKSAGKSTIANAISSSKQFSGLKIQQYGFADTLKDYCQALFGLNGEQCYGTEAEKNTLTKVAWDTLPFYWHGALRTHPEFMTGREVLQIFGTNIVRSMNPNAWVDATLARIGEDWADIALVTDVRFPNEVRGIQAHSGKVIRLTRAPHPEDTHPSETALDGYEGFDEIIDNVNPDQEAQSRIAISIVERWL